MFCFAEKLGCFGENKKFSKLRRTVEMAAEGDKKVIFAERSIFSNNWKAENITLVAGCFFYFVSFVIICDNLRFPIFSRIEISSFKFKNENFRMLK